MTRKEKAIRQFAKAMRNANIEHMALWGNFTPNMARYWYEYLEAVKKEYENGRSKE